MTDKSINFTYTNWRGVTEHRSVDPINIWYGSTKWHPDGDQWFLHAIDLNKSSGPNRIKRDFPLSGIFAKPFTDTDLIEVLREAFEWGRIYSQGCRSTNMPPSHEYFEINVLAKNNHTIAISKLRKAIGDSDA